jgi:transposase-like protein
MITVSTKLYSKQFTTISGAARQIGVCQMTIYRWKEKYAKLGLNEFEYKKKGKNFRITLNSELINKDGNIRK